MKKTILILICLITIMIGSVYSIEIYQLFYPSTLETINITPTIISGTNIDCSDVTGAGYDVCVGDGGGSVDYSAVQNYSNNPCGAGEYVYDRYQNGTFLCRTDQTGSGTYNPDNHSLIKTGVLDHVNGTWIQAYVDNSSSGGNSSFNQTLTDSLYADISVVDTTIGNCSVTDSCSDIVYMTYANLSYYFEAYTWGNHALASYSTVDDNASWNEVLANSLYADISVVDTTIGNCSVDGSCSAITYDSELSYITNCSVTDSCDNVVYNNDIATYWSTANFSNTDVTNWNTAYGWDDHSTQGYITDGNTNWDNSYGFFDNIANFTGTLTSGYHCRYDGTEIDCDVDTSGWDQDSSNDVVQSAITNMAQFNQSNTFAENQTFSKNITVSDCIVFSNGGKIGSNC